MNGIFRFQTSSVVAEPICESRSFRAGIVTSIAPAGLGFRADIHVLTSRFANLASLKHCSLKLEKFPKPAFFVTRKTCADVRRPCSP